MSSLLSSKNVHFESIWCYLKNHVRNSETTGHKNIKTHPHTSIPLQYNKFHLKYFFVKSIDIKLFRMIIHSY